MNPLVAGAAAAAALGLLALTLRRPAAGCALLMLLVPITTGLSRGSLVPFLKPSEVLVGIVCAGALFGGRTAGVRQELTWADLAVAAYVAAGVGVPTFVLLLAAEPAGTDTWRQVLAPVQLGAVFLLFSRTRFSRGELRLVCGLALLGGAIAGAVGVAELANLPGVRTAVAGSYATVPTPAWDTTYRPSSLVGHYSALGGLCLLNVILAVSLVAGRNRALGPWLLTPLLLANVAGTLASLTLAPLVLLPLALAAPVAPRRRLPAEVAWTLAALAVAVVVLWPSMRSRAADQGLLAGGQLALAAPETLQTRVRLWSEFIVPALRDHLWLGTGTVIPATVPTTLTSFVDNEYLWAGFRAGIPGIATLLLLLAAVAVAGWRDRRDRDPWRRSLGMAGLLAAGAIFLMGMTAEYLTFGGIVQEFAMLAGLASGRVARSRPDVPTLLLGARASSPLPATGTAATAAAFLTRRLPRPPIGHREGRT